MKVVFSKYFYPAYTHDPAAVPGRMESIMAALPRGAELVEAEPATAAQIAAAHTSAHIEHVRRQGLYEIAALAAGGAVQAAHIGLGEPVFAAIRPPGHHASADSAWGFCFFNNMAVALLELHRQEAVASALVLDIDLHYGDGTVDILGAAPWVHIYNPTKSERPEYLAEIEECLERHPAEIIGICAGFDNHRNDWGGLLHTDDYRTIGQMAARAALRNHGGCFAILEGGYNHNVLGLNAAALLEGMAAEKPSSLR